MVDLLAELNGEKKQDWDWKSYYHTITIPRSAFAGYEIFYATDWGDADSTITVNSQYITDAITNDL